MSGNDVSFGDILIVEDTMTQMLILESLLSEHGYNVSSVESGPAALQFCRARKPIPILSDVNMPGMSGYALCKTMKSDAQLGAFPFILLDSLADAGNLSSVLESGCDGFLYKDFEASYFIPALAGVLKDAQALVLSEDPAQSAQMRLAVLLRAAYSAAVYCSGRAEA
jgi:two-component system, sensor histidine kinase and response regulator